MLSLIILIVLWAYVAIVLALMSGEIRDRRNDNKEALVPFIRILQAAAVLIVLAPMLVWVARIDWYDEAEG